MTVASTRSVSVSFTGDLEASTKHEAAANAASPGQVQIVTLASGANTITVPSGGSTPTCCTIVKPSTNTTSITLKGVTGDTGVALHLTDPDSISIGTAVTSFCLTAGAQIIGVRLVWT